MLGQGSKTLDLNGYELRVDLDDVRGGSGKYNRIVTMFGVFSGTTLTLNDTSGKDTGKIFLNGCMRDANEAIGGYQSYMEGSVVHRNGIMVDGGEFIMNGGTIVGGRSREEWATAALDVDKVLGELNWGKLQLEEIDVGINFKFTGGYLSSDPLRRTHDQKRQCRHQRRNDRRARVPQVRDSQRIRRQNASLQF